MSSAVQPDNKPAKVATWSALEDRQPTYALVADVDLVVVRYDDQVSVFYGRCLHRGALMADGHVDGDNLICGVHQWDYRLETGISEYDNDEALEKFEAWIDDEDDAVYVDEYEVRAWEQEHPQPYKRDQYLGLYADFGALSEQAKTALAKGAELAGTGICSGEGGMLPEEQAANSRYFYELASGYFGWSLDKVARCQAFHFKGGQGAKTGTGGHLPGPKVRGKIAEVRGLEEGTPAISPSTFADLHTAADYREIAEEVRQVSGGIPIGLKMSAQHIEKDIDFGLDVGVDYLILDGRGGGTGAAPEIFKKNISIPTLVALARARRHLDARGRREISLVITGGLRTESDFVKALAMGADAVAVANSALQAIGCLGMRACHTNNCPVGIATQKDHLRTRLLVDRSATQLCNYFSATVELMKILARACGHAHLNQFCPDDLTTWKRDIAYLTGVNYAGVVPL